MAKFNATVEFSLTTEMTPEGVRFRNVEDVEGVGDFEDQCNWGSQRVTADGGVLSFEITALDEHEAETLVNEQIFEEMEVEDDNGFTWLVEGFAVDFEEIEWTPSVEEAIEILGDFVDSTDDERIAKCVQVVLDDHAQLGRRVQELGIAVRESQELIGSLESRLAALESRCSQPTQLRPGQVIAPTDQL